MPQSTIRSVRARAALLAGMTLSAAWCVAAPTTTAPARPAVGAAAPDFSLMTLDGKTITLSEARADKAVALVVLRGWPGYQCPICTKQVADLSARADAIAAAGGRVILVYPGPAEELKKHAEDFVSGKSLPASFTFVTDPDYAFTNAYDLRWDAKGETAYPSTFVIDRRGIVRFAEVSKGHDGRTSADELTRELNKLQP